MIVGVLQARLIDQYFQIFFLIKKIRAVIHVYLSSDRFDLIYVRVEFYSKLIVLSISFQR